MIYRISSSDQWLAFVFSISIVSVVYFRDIKARPLEVQQGAPYQINLGSESHIQRTVAANLDVAINCSFFRPIWYRRRFNDSANLDEELEDVNGANVLLIKSIQSESAGYYSCFTPAAGRKHRHWSNLTLLVAEPTNKKLDLNNTNDIADLEKIQTSEEVELSRDIWENVTWTGNSNQAIAFIQKIQGDDLKINCGVFLRNSNSNFKLFWYHNATLINDKIMVSDRFSLEGKVLKIRYLKPEDAGLYKCRVCDSQSGVDCPEFTTQLVIGQLENKVSPKDTIMAITFKDSSNTSNVDHLAGVSQANVKLAKSVTKIDSTAARDAFSTTLATTVSTADEDDDDLPVDQSSSDQDKASQISSSSNDDVLNGNRRFVVANSNVTVNSTEGPPQFQNKKNKFLMSVHKPAGNTLLLNCPYTANPPANITWTRNDSEIVRSIGKVVYKRYSITLDDAITDDSGVYTCQICNAFGCIKHSTQVIINDRLRSAPIHSDRFPQNLTALVNTSAIFECRVYSDLEPSFFWISYMNATNTSIRTLESKVPSIKAQQSLNKHTNILKLWPTDEDKPNFLRLTNVTHEHQGWYTCIAANSLGQSLASAYLTVVDELPSIKTNHTAIIVFASLVLLLILFGTVFIIYVLRKLKHERLLKNRIATIHQWTKKVIIYKPSGCEGGSCMDLQIPVIKIEKQRTTFQTSSQNGDVAQAFNEYEFPLDSNWELPRNQLKLGATLGEGAFGRVVMAETYGLSRPGIVASSNSNDSTTVAVKMVKEEHTDADMASLVREMEVMKIIGKHRNIINLLGCCTQNGPLWVIVEFAPHGNLKDFLKKNRPPYNLNAQQRNSGYLEEEKVHLTEKKLISFAFQIARGMEYLASRKCIHRDLAARNVLVSDDYIMKIADFGLARDIQDTDYYRKNTNGRLPIKWMAPESLNEKFYDSQSDVFSYGVLLWEIMTYGDQPYPNIMCAEELYSFLLSGGRMEKPPRCSLNIYMLMRQCWHFDANARPTFTELVENLDKILQIAQNHEEYLDLSMPILETPPSSSDEEDEIDYADNTDDDSIKETFRDTTPLRRYQYTYKFK